IAMVWRRSSAMGGFLARLAQEFRALPRELLQPPGTRAVARAPARRNAKHAA
ncbi:MAG TPA: DNA-binding transcriptional regulator OxyR, partial [Xanthomonadaceae bacterium]|nr:DNA-binding transcriptional regulator OxyR [Xanthomonadaceae bacterium]